MRAGVLCCSVLCCCPEYDFFGELAVLARDDDGAFFRLTRSVVCEQLDNLHKTDIVCFNGKSIRENRTDLVS